MVLQHKSYGKVTRKEVSIQKLFKMCQSQNKTLACPLYFDKISCIVQGPRQNGRKGSFVPFISDNG